MLRNALRFIPETVVHNVNQPQKLTELNKIPNNVKYFIYCLCALIFVLLNFGLGAKIHIGLTEFIQNATNYFFGFSSNTIDYLIIASIPAIGMLLNLKRKQFNISELIMDILTVTLWALIMFGIGLYIMTFIGKPTGPLIPDHLIIEPFYPYTTLTILIGISIPFVFINQNRKVNEIEDIGTE